jgi:hypothetical protein
LGGLGRTVMSPLQNPKNPFFPKSGWSGWLEFLLMCSM